MSTRKPTRKPPSYRLHAASGKARVTIDGRDRYLGEYDSPESHAEYHRVIAEWMDKQSGAESSEGRAGDASTARVATVLLAFQQWAEPRYARGREYEKYRPVVKALREGWGQLPVTAFGPRQLKRFRESLVKRGHARGYINQTMRRVQAIFRWVVSEELAPPTVATALESVRGLRAGESEAPETAAVRLIAWEVVEATLPHLSPPVAAIVRLLCLTGARPSEICAMRPCDVDQSGRVWLYSPAKHKLEHHNQARVIPLIPVAQGVLRPFLLRPSEQACFRPVEAVTWRRRQRAEARVTPMNEGNRAGTNRSPSPKKTPGDYYDAGTLRNAIEAGCRRAFPAPPAPPDIDADQADAWRAEHPNEALAWDEAWDKSHAWGPYRCRHLVGTLVRRVAGLDAARIALGHSTADLTARVYAEATAEDAARHLERMADQFKIA